MCKINYENLEQEQEEPEEREKTMIELFDEGIDRELGFNV